MGTDKNQIAEVFQAYPPPFRKKLERLRKIILDVAKNHPEIGELEETLKWGEPSFLPKKKNVGTTVRIHWLKSKPAQCGIYFNCNTTLVSKFRRKFGKTFRYEGRRAIVFGKDDDIPVDEIKECISLALTYHLNKRNTKKSKH